MEWNENNENSMNGTKAAHTDAAVGIVHTNNTT